MPHRLRDGSATEDRRLDRLVDFDPRSRNYPIRAVLGDRKPRSYTWRCLQWNDQGREGACVGFAWSHELAARPAEIDTADHALATGIYRRAQQIDEFPGEGYSGTSVLAGAKAVAELGFITEYRWAFGIEDLLVTLGYFGPAVLGVNWHQGMFQLDNSGFIRPTGPVMGGHAILARGVSIKKGTVLLRNSWGAQWGRDGDCLIRIDDLATLLAANGEACIPTLRRRR